MRLRLLLLPAVLYGVLPVVAQEIPRPPAAAPRPAPRRLPLDSAARESVRARERAYVDSMRQVSESLLRARRAAAGPPADPKPSPLSGEPPFYGYTWVFYADLVLGALVGSLAFRSRGRDATPAARRVWAVAGVVLGAAAGALVFLPFYLFNVFWSVGFSAMSPAMMFGLTASVVLLMSLGKALDRRR